MGSGFKFNGTDLDSILAAADGGGTTTCGFKAAGTDIGTRYALLADGTAPPATHFLKAGSDLDTVFALINTTGKLTATLTNANTLTGTPPTTISIYGYIASGQSGPQGALSPGSTIDGHAVVEIISTVTYAGALNTALRIAAASDPGSTYFTSIALTPPSGGPTTLTSASASYSYSSGAASATWQWSGSAPLASALGSWGVLIK